MSDNRGRDFLFSDDCGFINGEDGKSYRYSDGSRYYHGTDGSEGYIYSDGSGYYHGADGSDGYKYSDGSGYFNGSDGSRSLYDADDNEDNDDYDYNYSSDNSDDTDWVSGLAGLAVGLGALAVAKHTAQAREEARKEEERRLELEKNAEEKRHIRQDKRAHDRRIRNKRLKALFFNKKNLELEYSTSDLIGEDYKEVLEDLTEAGFNNCKAIPVKDIYVGNDKYVGEVEQVVINGQSWVNSGTMVPYEAEIIITYHLKREIEFPFSARQITKMTFEQVADALVNLGFTEVYTLPLKDLKNGWIRKENSVQQVVIAGIEAIKKGIVLEYDKQITIQYHSFANK